MILWLTARNGIPSATKAVLLGALRMHGVNPTDILFNSLHFKVPSLGEFSKKKASPTVVVKAALHALSQDVGILRPNLIVCNDEGTLRAITGKAYTLSQVRGSVYDFQGIPVLILDQFSNLWRMNSGKFIFGFDIQKLVRFATGKRKKEPAFNFYVCDTPGMVKLHCDRARLSTLISEDIETKNGFISCVSFTYDFANSLHSFCVPFFDPFAVRGAYWVSMDDEMVVRQHIADMQASDVPKLMQNGMYDSAYFVEAGFPPVNYLYDTANMMHALWCEAPKKLQDIASYFLDCYQYWKDEAKGVKEDGFGKSHADVERYWRYNGLDSYYTWLGGRELLSRLVQLPWAVKNYATTIQLGTGPLLAASLRGIKVDQDRHASIMADTLGEAELGLADIRRFTGEADFNPRSSRDVAWMLYDVLGAKITRLQNRKNSKYDKRSTDEKVLKLIKEQGNILVNNFIDRLLKSRKPAGVISKYGDLKKLCRNGRFISWLNPCATTTGRFNSGGSQFWTGTNGQNIPAKQREYYTADPDYVFLEIDYGASDDRFIAYETEDPVKIEVVEDKTKDIHCRHASQFFSIPYDKIYAGWKDEADWVVDSTTGVRQNTKRVTHGRNYAEEAETMYNVMGRDAVVATGEALGFKLAAKFSDKELIGICQILIDKYDHPQRGMYRRIRPWRDEICKKAQKNGNSATASAGGLTRKFFGDVLGDHATQRELASFYGQGGTAGNINRALVEIWYNGVDDGRDCLFLNQGHDSMLFAIHRSAIHHKIPQIIEIMERPCIIHGREMRVPTDPKIGLTWSKKMMTYKPGITYEEIAAFDHKIFAAKFKPKAIDRISSLLQSLGPMELLPEEDEEDELSEFEQKEDDAQSGDELELTSIQGVG